MKALITGINGFAGRYLEEYLKGEGYEVFGLGHENFLRNSNIFNVDIRDKKKLSELVEQIRPDRVYHLAAISFLPHSSIEEIYQINFLGTLNLCEALKELNQEIKLLFVSSSNVYGIVPREIQPIKEDFPLNPVSYYAISKANGEMLSKAYMSTGVKTVIARPFNHTGVGQNPKFVVPKIVKAFREKKEPIKLGNINVYRDFSDVRDVVKAYYLLLEKGENGVPYNICSGKVYAIKDVINYLVEISGHTINIELDANCLRSMEIPFILGDNSRIIKTIGWKSDIDFFETLNWMYHNENRH